MDRSIYIPEMSMRNAITYATNRIKAELAVICSYKTDDLKNDLNAQNSFTCHVMEIARETQNLLSITGGGNA